MSVDIGAPAVLAQPIHVPLKTLTGPGPSNVCDRVLQAQALPTLGHLHPEFTKIMDDIKAGVQYIFQTNNAMSFALSATGHAAMECVMTNLLEPGTVILIANNGIWGVRARDMAERQGADVRDISTPAGTNFSFATLEAAIKEHKPRVLFVTHGESSTGVVQPLEGLGDLCHDNDCLLAVDTVASLGGVPVYADRLNIDVIYTGSQKVLGVPPGTAPISFSTRATEHFTQRQSKPRSFYLDMGWLGEYWGCWPDKGRVYHHTGPVNAMYALREGLAMVAEEGLEKCWNRHKETAARLHAGLADLGLSLFVQDPEARLPTVNTIAVPEDIKDWKAVTDYCMANYKVEISGGLGPTAGKVWRIGVMGNNANAATIDKVLEALGAALKHVRQK